MIDLESADVQEPAKLFEQDVALDAVIRNDVRRVKRDFATP